MTQLTTTPGLFASFFKNEQIEPYAYLVYKRLQEGNICIDPDEVLIKEELPYEKVMSPSKLKLLSDFVSDDPQVIRPFILHRDKFYLQRYFNYESDILQSIGRLLKNESSVKQSRIKQLESCRSFIEALQAGYDLTGLPKEEQIDWQLTAAIQAVLHNFSIITGGPGTGKTTTVAKVLAVLFETDPNCRVALAAPTGKAAMRMAESLKQTSIPLSDATRAKFNTLTPSTIHRLLKYIPDSIYFQHHSKNPLPYDVLIVDEASMIDVALFAKLMRAVDASTKVILLGDKNQLASVEAGSMLGDLCKTQHTTNCVAEEMAELINSFIHDGNRKISKPFIQSVNHPLAGHIIELQHSHRFNSQGGIGKFSKAVITNDKAVLDEYIQQLNDPVITIDTRLDEQIFASFIEGYASYIREPDIKEALKKLNALRVLCAVKEGDQGLYTINKKIEILLQKKGLLKIDGEFYEHRPVIVTKNYPDLKLFNGDVGIIRRDENNQLRAWFEDSEGTIRSVMPGYIASAETVFAMTIHKSQGSEYNQVLILLSSNEENKLLTRELLYTAVTRAKQKVIIQATADIVYLASKQTVQRASGITSRFDEI